MGLIVAAALGGFAYAFTAPTQTGELRLPSAIEAVFPDGGDLDLRQATISVDLASGYRGALFLDGVPIPDDQIRTVVGLNQLIVTPDPGGEFAELRPGRHCASVTYWRIELSEDESATFRWCFRLH